VVVVVDPELCSPDPEDIVVVGPLEPSELDVVVVCVVIPPSLVPLDPDPELEPSPVVVVVVVVVVPPWSELVVVVVPPWSSFVVGELVELPSCEPPPEVPSCEPDTPLPAERSPGDRLSTARWSSP
jgi:hypothetical protein